MGHRYLLSLPWPKPISTQLLTPFQGQVEVLLLSNKRTSTLLLNSGMNKSVLIKRLLLRRFFINIIKNFKKIRQPSLAIILIVALILASLILSPQKSVFSATYTFIQTNWLGGISADTAVHPTNQTGWNKYANKDSNVAVINGGADVTLTVENFNVTDDGILTTTGQATGGTFSACTYSNTQVTGLGESAYVQLAASINGGTGTDGSLDLSLGGASGGCNGTGMTWDGINTCTFNTSIKSAYNFTSITIPANTFISVIGSQTLTLKVTGNFTIYEDGAIIANGFNGAGGEPGAGGNSGGSGGIGGIGGTRSPLAGSGLGAGSAPSYTGFENGGSSGGGGGGHGGAGGTGGSTSGNFPVAGGNIYNNYSGGSGGGGGGGTNLGGWQGGGGGGGGGMVNITVAGTFILDGLISVNGGNGANALGTSYGGGGGGGSGGYVIIYANILSRTNATGAIEAKGGNGGNGTPAGFAGGGGGGGLIVVYTSTGTSNVSRIVTGGVKGSTNNTYATNGNGGSSLLTNVPYPTSGTFTSAIIDLTRRANFSTLTYNITTPDQTGITIDVRAGNTPTPDDTWTAWQTNISNGGSISSLNGNRYVQYRANFSTTNTAATPSLNSITFNYSQFTFGTLTSSSYDSSDPANIFGNIAWNATGTSSSETVRFQVRSSTDNSSWSNWCGFADSGSTCTGTNYFTSSYNGSSVASNHPLRNGGNDRYLQYKLLLESGGLATPTLNDVTLTYVVNAPPQLQNVTASQSANGLVTISYQVRDVDTSTGTYTPGFVTPSFQYWNGSSWQNITALAPGDTTNKAVNEVSYTSYTATWSAAVDFPNQFMNGTAKVRVTVNDNEVANNTTALESNTFILDTKPPVNNYIVVNATTIPAGLNLASTDDSALEMKISLNSNLAGASFVPFNSSSTISLATNPGTVYAQFRDAYGNLSPIINAVTPEMPTAVIIQDTSNMQSQPPEYRLFIAWKTVANPGPGFGSYKIYRSTDQNNWSVVGTITNRLTNYYGDNTVSTGITYYYRVVTTDSLSNHSFNSVVVSGIADGVQNGDEGGGNVPPVISEVSVSNITSTTALITWSTDILSDSSVDYEAGGVGYSNTIRVPSMVNNITSVGQHRVVLSGLEPKTMYYFRVRSANSQGFESIDDNNSSGYTFETSAAPVISGTTIPSLNNTSARIIWQTSHSADSYVVYDTAADFSSSNQVGNSEMTEQHEVILSDLSPNTRYYFYVTSDDGNNRAEDRNVINGVYYYYQFITTNDNDGPAIFNISAQPSTTGATIFWTTNENANSQVEYGTTASYGTISPLDNTLTIQHSVTVTGLTPNTLYHYRIRSADSNGNLSLSSNQTFSTLAAQDLSAPIISNVQITSVALNSAIITWITNESANSIIDYGTSTAYGTLAGNMSSYNTNHSVTLIDLTGNTTYYFQVRSQDVVGNLATDDNGGSGYSFTTTADITPPVITNITTALVSDTSAIITWQTNEPTTAQVVYGLTTAYGNQTLETTELTTTQSVLLTGLTRNTQYFYKVVARDASFNITTDDNESEGYSFTTTLEPASGSGSICLIDRLPPQLTEITATAISATSIKVSWFTAEPSNSLVDYGLTEAKGGLAGDHRNFINQHEVILKNLLPATVYLLRANSYDNNGNRGESDVLTITTLAIGEEPILLSDDQITPTPKEPAFVEPEEEIMSVPEQDAVNLTELASPSVLSKILQAFTRNPFLSSLPEDDFITIVNDLASRIIGAPTIEGSEPKVVVDGVTATITWRTNKKSSSLVAYSTKANYKTGAIESYDQAASNPGEFDFNHIVKLVALEPATTYFFQVRSKGSLGPEARSPNYSFTTGSVAPIVDGIRVIETTANTATLSWRTNVPTSAIVEYTNLNSNETLTQGETSLLRDRTLILKGLEINTDYSAVISVRDEYGTEARSGAIKFSTTIDKIPPVISKVMADSTLFPGKDSKVQTIISWETNEPSSSQVYYQEGLADDAIIVSLPLEVSLVTKHIIVVTRFKPATVYKFWVESKDSSGNLSRSDDFTILTPQERQTIIDVIINNFESTFGWLKRLRR